MFLSDASVRRPVAMCCLIIALSLLGLNSFREMGMEWLPRVDLPYITVVTVYPGGSREEIETDIAKDLVITCDRVAVERCLANLVMNSLEAMARAVPEVKELKIEASYLNSFRNAVSITIEDNGGGIPEELLGRVFEPFTSGASQTRNGLGVTIAKQLVDRHNGILAYNSEEGVGTTFQVVLPTSPDSQISGTVSGKLS